MVVAGLDYRKLTDESVDPLASLQPVLTSQNVLSISKLASRLPVPGGGDATVSASAVHAAWLRKLFWKGDPQLLKRAPQSDHEYLHAYDTCAKYLDRLAPADAVRFLDDITFSPDAAKHVSLILSSCLWFSKSLPLTVFYNLGIAVAIFERRRRITFSLYCPIHATVLLSLFFFLMHPLHSL